MQELQVNIEQAKVEIVGQEVFEKGIADVVAKYQNYHCHRWHYQRRQESIG